MKNVGNSPPIQVNSVSKLRYFVPVPQIGYQSDWNEIRYYTGMPGAFDYIAERNEFHGIVGMADVLSLPKLGIAGLNKTPHIFQVKCLVYWVDGFGVERGSEFTLSPTLNSPEVFTDDEGETTLSGELIIGEEVFMSADVLTKEKGKYSE